jgi:hypothetical protein
MHGAIPLPFPSSRATPRLGSLVKQRDLCYIYIFDFGIQFGFIMAIFFTVHDILHNTGHLSNSVTQVSQLLLGINKMQDLRCYTLLTQITIVWNITV